MIRLGALIIVAAAGGIGRIIASSLHALNGIRTNIGIFRTITGTGTLLAFARILTAPGAGTVGPGIRAAGYTRRKRPAGAGFIGTSIRRCARIAVTAAGRIRRIIAMTADTLYRICANIIILPAIGVFGAFGASPRILTTVCDLAISLRRNAYRALISFFTRTGC